MIVADTNLAAYLLIEGDRTQIARAVWARDPEWMFPTLWRSEFLNVLATAMRAGVLSLGQAHETWLSAWTIFQRSEVEPSGDDVIEVAAERRLTAYDAQFVVAAIDLNVPLVTFDRRLLGACPDLAIAPEHFAAR